MGGPDDEVDGFVQNEAGLFIPTDLIDPVPLVDIDQVTYASRKLAASWTMPTDFSDWQLPSGPQYPDNPVDIINDALDDPNYDPEKPYIGLPRWPDGRVATEEEVQAHNPIISMAAEMRKEIDAEIMEDLRNAGL